MLPYVRAEIAESKYHTRHRINGVSYFYHP